MFVDKDIAQERYDICKSCDRFLKLTKQCEVCACFMNFKVKFKDTECPLGKWTKHHQNLTTQ